MTPYVLLGVLVIVGLLGCRWLFASDAVHRGRRVLAWRQARKELRRAARPARALIPYGDLSVPETELLYGLLALGLAGSGKTLSLRLILQAILPTIAPGSDRRALVFDQKGEWLPILAGLPLNAHVETLHPFDARGCAWDIAADTKSPAHASELSHVLFPDSRQDTTPFFRDAARHLVSGVVQAWMLARSDWDLRDLILATRSARSMATLLSRHPVTRSLVGQYLEGDDRLTSNIISTLATKLAPFETIAAGWARAGRRLSLAQWLAEESILVLGADPAARAPLAAINSVLVNRLGELLLAQADCSRRRTYLVLDELASLGKLAQLPELLALGRAKGIAVLASAQTLALWKSAYGTDDATALLAQLQNRCFFRLGSPEDAQWASQATGDVQLWRANRTSQGATTSSLVTEPAVLPSQFLSLPPTNPQHGMTAFWAPRLLDGVYHHSVPWQRLLAQLLPADPDIPGCQRRDDRDLFLQPWSDDDLRRLGLEAAATAAPTSLPGRRDLNL